MFEAPSSNAPRLDRFEVCAALTLLLLLLYSSNLARLPASILAVAALIIPPLRRNFAVWAGAAALLLGCALARWWAADNHDFLEAYWCLALGCALRSRDRDETLAQSARLLIGLSFLLAVGWKLASKDYLNGDFFVHTLVMDPRFRGFSAVMGGVSDPIRDVSVAARSALVSYDSNLLSAPIVTPPFLPRIAMTLTIGTALLEAGVALTFLFRLPERMAFLRNVLLLVFILSVYSVATVVGFGWTLATMGIAQCEPHETRSRACYLASILLLQAYRIPWVESARQIAEWASR
jgi:hypothetical protein